MPGWRYLDDEEIRTSVAVVETCGWLVHRDDKYIAVAATLSGTGCLDIIRIPMVNVKQIKFLKV